MSAHGPRAILNAIERLAGSYESECARAKQELAIAENQLRDYQTRLGKPFDHESYLSQLTAVRDQLKACLTGAQPEPTGETPPNACDLAEQIKALKESHTIEGAPNRIGTRQSAAEEPVTARIRRRMTAPRCVQEGVYR